MSQLPSFTTDLLRSKRHQKTPETEQIIDPVQEEAKRKTAQEKWKKLLSNHIEEGKRYGRSEIDSMDRAVYLSRVATPEENREYNWAFESENFPDRKFSQGVPWRKWGGGNKGPSGTNATRKAAIAKISQAVGDNSKTVNVTLAPDAKVNNYQHRSYDDGFGFKINQALARINAKFNDTQGKNLPSNPSFRGAGNNKTFGTDTSSVGKFRGFDTLGGSSLK
tara:strand:- start:9074 stop:9736 length:663 start_codon:yes stop_codon:yes gene_type:complete